jgi:hypothetical protein
MSKTLLLIICDFLLLSMLALARFDTPDPEQTVTTSPAANTEERELLELLELSLQSELASRERLSDDLTETRSSLAEREQLLAEREASLEEARREAEALAEARAREEAERVRAERERVRLEAESQRLAENFEQTRRRLEATEEERVELTRSLGNVQESAAVAQERLRQAQEALREREAELARRSQELERLAAERERLAGERESAVRDLEVTRAERGLLAERLATEQTEREILRQERERMMAQTDRLTEGVGTLAEGTENIRQEIERSRPQSMSAVYSQFERNQVAIELFTRTRGLLGESTRTTSLGSSLVTDGRDTFIVFHAADSPLNLSTNPDRLLEITAQIRIGDETFTAREIGFHSVDPRILFTPVPERIVQRAGKRAFMLSDDPNRFEEAILIQRAGGNFGRTAFRRITASERFLRMDRPLFGELFADFSASRGDWVFSKNGDFIGLMVTPRHATVVEGFVAAGRIGLGNAFNAEEAATTIGRLRQRFNELPSEVK